MNWQEYWNQQNTPMHAHSSDEWYQLYAQEINLLCKAAGVSAGPVLESGCGNGALYEYYDFIDGEYVGIDFSETLLQQFKERYPSLELGVADAASYSDQRKFSLVFSNGVVQYFEPPTLARYIENNLSMLDETGVLLLINIPNSVVKPEYYSGEMYSRQQQLSFLKKLVARVRSRGRKDGLGYWYRPADFASYDSNTLNVTIYGSLFHPYRFSVAITRA